MAIQRSDGDAPRELVPFSCESERLDDGVVLVHAAGELDIHTSAEFQKVLLSAQRDRPSRLVVDLSQVTFMDSTALGVLILLQRNQPQPLDVVVTLPSLRRVLAITSLDKVFSVHASLEKAQEAA